MGEKKHHFLDLQKTNQLVQLLGLRMAIHGESKRPVQLQNCTGICLVTEIKGQQLNFVLN